MSDQDKSIPQMAFSNVHSHFNDAKARAVTYVTDIQAHISKQQDLRFNIDTFRDDAQKLTEMQELADALQSVRDRFCQFDDTW
jgi:hypothetical protein